MKPKKTTKAAIAATEAARDAIEVTRKSSQAELRAYIHLENIEITGLEPGSTEVPRIAVVLKNHGLTPAHKVRDMGATQVLYSEDAHLTIDDDVPRTNMDIGPSQQLTRTHFLKVATWKQYKDDVFAKRGDLYIFGRVIYEDAFGETRHTNYRAKLFVHKFPEKGIEMVVSAEGNEST